MGDIEPNRRAFLTQRDFCLRMGAPITAAVCEALAEALDRESVTGRRVLDWPDDAIGDALPLRLVGGLHALAQAGDDHAVAAVFAGETGDTAAILRAALRQHDTALLPWLDGPPQTNEAGRAAPLMLGLMAVAQAFGQPIELLEIGSSAGINLLIDRFGFDLGGTRAGVADSAIVLRPEWRGAAPAPANVRIASTRGVDVAPVDAADPAQAARLRAYVWADNTERLARIDAAIAMLRERPVALEAGDAADWVEARMAEPQAADTTRVLMHSVVWQYLGPDRQARIAAAMAAAGTRADAARPLAWVRMEPDRDLARHELWVETWPGDGARRLAFAHAHGAWVEVGPPIACGRG